MTKEKMESDWPLSLDDAYILSDQVKLWNPQVIEKFKSCPDDWDEEELGDRPMSFYGIYIVYCSSGECSNAEDFEYELLPGCETEGPCTDPDPWWSEVALGFCSPEAAEHEYFRKSKTITHNGGNMSIFLCGSLSGHVTYGIDILLNDQEEDLIGDPIEDCLSEGINYPLQVFGDNLEECGSLGIGGNLHTDPDRPGWYWVNVKDPFELGCPGFAGHPDLDGLGFKYPNYGLISYIFSGGAIKYDLDHKIEYELPSGEYQLTWTSDPPKRPEPYTYPKRHTKNGAWVKEVNVDYYEESGSTNHKTEKWWLELVWNQPDGVWMLVLFAPEGKPSTEKRSPWPDVFVNSSPIGPCRLALNLAMEDRYFVPMRSHSIFPIDGEFVVQPLF